MSGSLSLNGTWQLTWAEGDPLIPPEHFMGAVVKGRRMLPARVPAPIHQVLMEAGLVEDPTVGMNSLKARWVEEQYWVYRLTFTAPEEAPEQRAELLFDRLEYDALVLLNGEAIGRHATAFRPARFDVTGKLRPGENLLVVRIDAGLQAVADRSAADYTRSAGIELLTKRHWHRKPQYQSGWDWNPRLMNVGILGDVRLEWRAAPRLDQVAVFALPDEDYTAATVHVRAFVENKAGEVAGTLRARIVETGAEVCAPVTIHAGESRHEVMLEIPNPRLWWPRGHGEQHLYTVEVTLEAGGEAQQAVRRVGVRRVEMDQSPHPVAGQYCTLKINGRPIFCKGGNWVPADLFYSTVDEARTRELIALALAANFNMLRVWGGGYYVDHAFCERCDEAGMMIWHDCIFACMKYPGDDVEFVAEVRRELRHVVRELANHPSLVVWCGNNEIEWGDREWGFDSHGRVAPHYGIFHRDIPRIVEEEDPPTLHWISSPCSPGCSLRPNDPTVGDQHPWGVSLGNEGAADWWDYRSYVDRFPNEGGVLGASSPATLRQFLPERERHLRSQTWDHHDNPFALGDSRPGAPGHSYSTVELWTGRDPETMEWEEYAFTSALLQAEGLREYIANYRRRMFSSACAIFWMYNDSWPVTHGWTIVDYYRRKKLAYHPVRRAFAPVSVVVAEEGGEVTVYGINDTPEPWSGEVRYGLFGLAGGRPVDKSIPAALAANAATPLARFARADWEALGVEKTGAFAVLTRRGEPVAQHRLFLARFRDLAFVTPEIHMSMEGETLTLTSDAFAWGVCLDVEGERPLADNCFDLIPGIPYTLPWAAALGAPQVVRLGNRDAVRPAALPAQPAPRPAEPAS
jgi:beta-mannosidase